jgi:sulfite exporter TauE/SafE
MKLNYKTERLPQNYIALGYLLIMAGVWISLLEDWKGILYMFAGVILVFVESGIIIDSAKRELKQYTGIFFLKKGRWQSIGQSTGLVVVKTQETQSMHVLSLSRSVTDDVYKLWLLMPEQNIELMTGARPKIMKRAEVIAKSLKTSLVIEE